MTSEDNNEADMQRKKIEKAVRDVEDVVDIAKSMADQPLSDSDRNILETIEIITEYDKMLATHPESKEVLTKLKRQIERVLLGHLEFKARYEPVSDAIKRQIAELRRKQREGQ